MKAINLSKAWLFFSSWPQTWSLNISISVQRTINELTEKREANPLHTFLRGKGSSEVKILVKWLYLFYVWKYFLFSFIYRLKYIDKGSIQMTSSALDILKSSISFNIINLSWNFRIIWKWTIDFSVRSISFPQKFTPCSPENKKSSKTINYFSEKRFYKNTKSKNTWVKGVFKIDRFEFKHYCEFHS